MLIVLRVPILRTAGSALVADDPLSSADAIVVTVDAGAAGMLEAADLYHAGISKRVAIFAEPPTEVDRELTRRGVKYSTKAAVWMGLLGSQGVTTVEEIALHVSGTEDEGAALPRWCQERRVRSVVVVTSPDHSRRMRRVLERTAGDHGITVMVRPARVMSFDPNTWWQSRSTLRTGIVELQKLLLDVARHPLQ